MAAFNPNLALGELMNNPLFWVMACVIGFMALGIHFGWFSKLKFGKKFKEENLNESIMKDLRPRMKITGKKIKNTKLVHDLITIGKVRKAVTSKVEYHTRTSDITDFKKMKLEKDVKANLKKESLELIYLTVGGNSWLSWIPYLGKGYDPDYFVLNAEHVKHDSQSKIYFVDKDIHLYPYAKIWLSDKKTQQYLTELEARRTQEFEAETNINTLKRWTHYNEPQSGRVVLMEKETDLEKDKWDNTRQTSE